MADQHIQCLYKTLNSWRNWTKHATVCYEIKRLDRAVYYDPIHATVLSTEL